jgi:hypothetical protein
MGTKHLRTPAYHPQAIGIVERFHRELKSSFKCHGTENWTEILPIVLLGIRTAIKEDINASFSELLILIRLPGDYFTINTFSACYSDFVNNYKQNLRKIHPAPATYHGTLLFLKNFLQLRTYLSFVQVIPGIPKIPINRVHIEKLDSRNVYKRDFRRS